MLPSRRKDKPGVEMRRALAILLHAGYWSIYLLLLTLIFAIVDMQARRAAPNLRMLLPLLVLYFAPNLISFYGCYLLLFTRFLSRRRIPALIVSVAAIALIAALAGVLLSVVFFGLNQAIFTHWQEFCYLLAIFSIIAA